VLSDWGEDDGVEGLPDGFDTERGISSARRPTVSAASYLRVIEKYLSDRGLDRDEHLGVLHRRGRPRAVDSPLRANLAEAVAAAAHLRASTVTVAKALGISQQRASELMRAASA
jgi:hypothetical protein